MESANLKDSIKIEILSRKLIKPSSPTPPHLQCYKLGFFDQVANRERLPAVFLYPNDSSITEAKLDERLETSLSKILYHVYPFTGRWSEDEFSILCLDQGVPYTKAKVNCKLENFLEETGNDLELAVLFWANDNEDDVDDTNLMTQPIFMAQVTRFECGGLAVALSYSHAAVDGFTAVNFAIEWANACRLGTPVEKIPKLLSFNSGEVFPPRDLSRYCKTLIPQEGSKAHKFVSKRFVINEAALSRLGEQFTSLIESGELSFKPSRVEMVSTLLWRALIRVSEAIHGHLRPCLMGYPLNLRSKVVSLPEIKKSMGNLVIEIPMKFVPGETPLELYKLIILIRDAVTRTVTRCVNASPDDIVSHVANLYVESFQAPEWGGNEDIEKIICSSLCMFPMQDADFGLGKPSLIFLGSKDKNMFWLHDTVCRTGIGLQVDLKQSYMQLFESDVELKSFIQST